MAAAFTFGASSGSAATTQPNPGPFGTTTTSTAGTSQFGGFAPAAKPAASGFGGFGTTTAPALGGLGSGTATTQIAPFGQSQQSQGFSFSQTQPATGLALGQSQPATGFPFGQPQPATGLALGQSQPATGFSFSQPQPATGLALGQSQPATGFPFGQSQQAQNVQQNFAQINPLLQDLQNLAMAYDQHGPHYCFKFVFYESPMTVPEGLAPGQDLQDAFMADSTWDEERKCYIPWDQDTKNIVTQARKDNPDKHRLVPALRRGIAAGLQGRVEEQNSRALELEAAMSTLTSKLEEMEARQVDIQAALLRCQHRNGLLRTALLAAVCQREKTNSLAQPLSATEQSLARTMETLKDAMEKPRQAVAHLEELSKQAQADDASNQFGAAIEPVTVDEHSLRKCLATMQEGLDKLVAVLRDSREDCNAILSEI